ncbi:unnamed protein product [Thelazia callipaeda]|uniref:GLOBIN domain-containing protein n=1 Tax=Thelazia callipaeda TaxID=103827 RepID=A0A0N5D3J0_THECL|nr:unnamed protein product [Thelazia callipaeda]
MLSRIEVQNNCMKVLNEAATVGTDQTSVQHGLNFYKYMFKNYPDLRKYFKGAEHYTPEDVQNSERFVKQDKIFFCITCIFCICYVCKFLKFKGIYLTSIINFLVSGIWYVLGQRILLAIRIIVNTYNDHETFLAYARETVNRHVKFKMDRNLWMGFFLILVEFLKEYTEVNTETEQSILQIGKDFADECVVHTVALNLPH